MKITTESHSFFKIFHDDGYIDNHGDIPIVSLHDTKQPKRKYILKNDIKKEHVVYHIDGGLVSEQNTNKCDYGVYTEDDLLILIELKGCDYNHALEQINSTIDNFKRRKAQPSRVCARIVASKIPSATTSNTVETKLVKRLKQLGNGTLRKMAPQLSEALSTV